MTPSFAAWLLLLVPFSPLSDGFATPKSEFLLEVDGNGVTTSRDHFCAIEQRYADNIGGRAVCWGDDMFGRTDPPTEVR